MCKNIYTRRLVEGKYITDKMGGILFRQWHTRISLWSLPDLIRLYPSYKIVENKYLTFVNTDILIHLDNYEYFYNQQENGAYFSLPVNPLLAEFNETQLIYIKLDNGRLNDHRIHYVYPWMFQSIISRGTTVMRYILKESTGKLTLLRQHKKKLTPSGFKKLKRGIVWI